MTDHLYETRENFRNCNNNDNQTLILTNVTLREKLKAVFK